ncbi:hypothetical protein LDO51_13610 [Providencia alcalifaciens]|uniref:hypothetical protein n=1 Tax=Providencia alcalifaciens TaxID=126385 RepID=UPI001CE1B2C0|nr:hypothetical protein LDO51_13610 [Providencia alcalifaciens]
MDWNMNIKTLKNRVRKIRKENWKDTSKILGRKPAPNTHATATGCGKNQLTTAK